MRLRSWGVLMTALFTATTAMADNGYPSRTGSGYSGPRWYGYYANNSTVSANADHTNITEIWATPLIASLDDATARANQVSDAKNRILAGLALAQQNGEKAMVDVGAIVFIPSTQSPANSSCSKFCYYDNPNAVRDFNDLVTALESDPNKYLNLDHPELSTVVAFYVADEPDINGLADHEYGGTAFGTNGTPGGTLQLLDAVRAIRGNPDTANIPLATIVSNAYYGEMPNNLGLFDWVGLDDYEHDVETYLADFTYFEDWARYHDVVGGTTQRYFMVPAVSLGAGSAGPYEDGASALYQEFANDHRIIGIMPFAWNYHPKDCTSCGGMVGYPWAPSYIALGKSIVSSPAGGVTLSPSVSSSGSFALNWPQDATATYYQVYQQSTADGGAPWTSTNVSTNSFTATNLANGTYGFYVQACNTSGCAPATGLTLGTVNISAPVSLSLSPATSRSGSFTLSWQSSWNGPYPFQQYRIFQSFNGGDWTWTATVNNTTSHVFTDLAPGSYAYYIVACNQGSAGAADCSGNSGQATETVSMSGPSGLTFSPSGTSTDGSFTLSWNSTWNGPYPFEQYHIYQSTNGGASWTWVYTINNTTSKAISGLADGTYTYKIQACNHTACGYFSGTASETVGKGGGGIGGCPPPPLQCQLVMPDDYAVSRGDQATPGGLALAKQYAGATVGVVSLPAERAQRALSLILPGEEVAWQQRLPAAPEMALATGVHLLPGDAQLARRVNSSYEGSIIYEVKI